MDCSSLFGKDNREQRNKTQKYLERISYEGKWERYLLKSTNTPYPYACDLLPQRTEEAHTNWFIAENHYEESANA
jgi:hypothetical protein